MTLYRALFVLFGFLLGWLLWRNNQSERELRSLIAAVQKLQANIEPPALIIHTQTQLLLTKSGIALPPEIEIIVRSIYEQSTKLQSIARDSTALLAHPRTHLGQVSNQISG